MDIIKKIEQATNEELLQETYIKENILENLCKIDINNNPDLKELLKKLWGDYELEQGEIFKKVRLRLDSMLFQISCLNITEEDKQDTKIPECFEHAYFWHYFFAMAFPLAGDEEDSLCDLIQEQYPLVEDWLLELFKDDPLQLELDDKILTIQFELDEVKYSLDDEEIFALFDYDTLTKLTKDDEVLFMLLLPVVLNEPNKKIQKDLLKMVEEFPIYEGLHQRVTELLVKHITTEVS